MPSVRIYRVECGAQTMNRRMRLDRDDSFANRPRLIIGTGEERTDYAQRTSSIRRGQR
jgi:hypothetical protein